MSAIKKRSISLSGHRTSYSIEDEFFISLNDIAQKRAIPLARLIAEIDQSRAPQNNLSSALRLAVLSDLKSQL